MKRYYSSSVIFVVMITIIIGCVPSKPVKELKQIPASRVVKKVEANRRKISTFKASGILDVNSPKISAKANFEVQLKKPDSLKLAVYGPFGIELAQAVITPNEFRFYDPINKKLYKGSNHEGIIEKILKIDLSFNDLMDALSGSVNLTNKLSENPDYFDITDDEYKLTYINKTNQLKSVYNIQKESLGLLSYNVLSEAGKPILKGTYTNFRIFNEVPIPYNSKIEYAKEDQSLDIEYRNIDINIDIPDLTLNLPTDIQIVEW